MNGTPEGTADELLPKYAELVQMVQMAIPTRFLELARTYNIDEEPEEAPKNRPSRNRYAGKILCAARTVWEQQRNSRQQSFPDYFEMQYGCRPSNHGLSCAKTYRNLVQTGKITESDYDANSVNAITAASRIISKVADDLGHARRAVVSPASRIISQEADGINHPAVEAAASILRRRSPSAGRELLALFDRLSEDLVTGQVKLLEQAPAADLNSQPLTYSPASELAFKIAKDGHQSVLAAPLEQRAASTPDLSEARVLAAAAVNILTSLSNNRDEHGQRRFSDELIAAWKSPEVSRSLITPETLKSDYAAAKAASTVAQKKFQEIGEKLHRAGIAPPEQHPTQAPIANPDANSNPMGQVHTFKRWRSAELCVLELMHSWAWQVEDVSHRKLGYDIVGRTHEGKEVFADVKTIHRTDEPFTLTPNQEAVASEKREAYLIVLVRLTATHVEIALISDPVHKLTLRRRQRMEIDFVCADYPFQPKRYPLVKGS